jgi:hypothetical protein
VSGSNARTSSHPAAGDAVTGPGLAIGHYRRGLPERVARTHTPMKKLDFGVKDDPGIWAKILRNRDDASGLVSEGFRLDRAELLT